MHELTIAQAIVEQACSAAREHGGRRIRAITVRVGLLSGVDPHALEFAFPLAAEQTPAEGAVLRIESEPVVVRCRECGTESPRDDANLLCPKCGSVETEMLSGGAMILQSVDLDRPEPDPSP